MDYKESFLQYLQVEKRYSPHTLRSYRNDLDQFYNFQSLQEGTFDPGSVSSQDIRSWIVSLLGNEKKRNSPVSVRRKISTLRVFFRYLRKEGVIKADPLEKVVLPKTKKRLPVFVSEESINGLLDGHDFGNDFKGIRNRLVIEMLYLTGIRRSELTGLRDQDIDFGGCTLSVTGKRNKQRILPLLKTFADRMREYKATRNEHFGSEGGGWFFVGDKGNKMYDKYVYNIVRNYLAMVTTIEKKSPHILRHTFATHMLNRGADLNSIKEFLGHANLSATQIYTHNTFEKLRNIYRKAHPRA
ncbi:MAG: tyrosine-type recombinase/integrase [Bacteroidales bacterium]